MSYILTEIKGCISKFIYFLDEHFQVFKYSLSKTISNFHAWWEVSLDKALVSVSE